MKVRDFYMIEIKLNSTDYTAIKEIAMRKYLDLSVDSGDTFVSLCYAQALVEYTNKQHLVIKEGKVFKNDK